MGRVQGLRQKIAGKSIPLEVRVSTTALSFFSQRSVNLFHQKLVARKARKFHQDQYLALPALELAYFFNGIASTPRTILVNILMGILVDEKVIGMMFRKVFQRCLYAICCLSGELFGFSSFHVMVTDSVSV